MNKQRTHLTLLLAGLAVLSAGKIVWAEGSRDLYPSSYPAGGSRATAFYSTDLYGNLLRSHTIFYVYAKQNEYILLGSSAIGVGSGDALIYAPGAVTGPVGGETFGAAAFRATAAQPGRGVINSRALELAGPQAISGGGNSGGYVPCYYQVPSTGIYGVVFYGPDGPSVARNGSPDGTVNFSSSNSTEAGTGQHTNVTAWDVTVRSSDTASTTDEKGRVFANYLTLFTGGNARPLYSSLYAATLDGYQYQISLLGMDPNAFAIYGNQVGFFDSDGTTPLYHDILGHDANVSSPEGNVKLAVPTFPLFFNTPDPEALTEDNIPLSPITPVMTGLTFHGTLSGNTSTPGTGGTFTFSSNVSAIYDLVISRDSVDFDPTNPNNRRLRGLKPSGGNTVSWDGKDNSGVAFPVGTNYAVHGEIHGGEYHFPMLDVENNLAGGPSFTLLNATNPYGNSTGYYDDRGYRAAGGFYVTYSASNSPASSNNPSLVNHVLGGLSPPSTTYSNPISGFNTVTSSQRAFGNYNNPGGGNQNVPNTGSFGDTKGLDIWTYTASADDNATLNILTTLPPTVLLVKRITAINGADVTGFADDPGTTDDDNPDWPQPRRHLPARRPVRRHRQARRRRGLHGLLPGDGRRGRDVHAVRPPPGQHDVSARRLRRAFPDRRRAGGDELRHRPGVQRHRPAHRAERVPEQRRRQRPRPVLRTGDGGAGGGQPQRLLRLAPARRPEHRRRPWPSPWFPARAPCPPPPRRAARPTPTASCASAPRSIEGQSVKKTAPKRANSLSAA